MEFDDAPSHQELASVQFAMRHEHEFTDYVEMRLHGMHSHLAFRRAFPSKWINLNEGNAWLTLANAVDFNPWVTARLRDRIAEVPAGQLWNPKISVHEMLCLARDPLAKDTSRLGAMKELNIMLNITVVDENGKTKAGRKLADFYAENGAEISGEASIEVKAAADAIPEAAVDKLIADIKGKPKK